LTRVRVLHPEVRGGTGRDPVAALAEAVGLADALELDCTGGEIVAVDTPSPATLFGPGKTAEIGAAAAGDALDLVVVNGPLSPVQQRNLERAWQVKVLDRTGLILEIFGERAQTKEGVLQVELAHLTYQKSRLVRSWTHLERQRGGGGFMGGPGETQIESDRRMLDERIARLTRQLDKVTRTRTLHRAARQRAPHPVVALVGYTNAGKSTLFNLLTDSAVVAKDMAFATLDPTMRRIALPSGRIAILSDTVGFISDLPTQLVAAFRATLEEVLEADLVVHVRDLAHPESRGQAGDVCAVLAELGLTDAERDGMLEIRNKLDLLDPDRAARERSVAAGDPRAVAVSAHTGEGLDRALAAIEDHLFPRRHVFSFLLGHDEGAAVAWLYRNAQVVGRSDSEDGVHIRAELTETEFSRFDKAFAVERGQVLPVSGAARE